MIYDSQLENELIGFPIHQGCANTPYREWSVVWEALKKELYSRFFVRVSKRGCP